MRHLRGSQPRLVRINAPAGYGKSTFARQYLEGEPGVVECDCFGVSGALDILRRLDLALGMPAKETAFSDVSARVAALQSYLGALTAPTTLLLENAEALADDRAARDVIAGVLAVRNPVLRIVVCSRVILPLRYGRFAGPQETAFIGVAHLRLSRDEIAGMLRTCDSLVLERVEALTKGWPIVVSMIARLDRLTTLPEMLDRLERREFDALEEYLVEEVLDQLDPHIVATVIACIASIDGRLGDVRLLREQGHAMASIAEMLQRCALASAVRDERCDVHPLLRDALLHTHRAEVYAMRRRLADELLRHGEALRAATLYFALDDHEAAAEAISHAAIFTFLESGELLRAIERLDRETLLRHPVLWSAAISTRAAVIASDELLDEALIVWSRVDGKTPIESLSQLVPMVVFAALDVGRIETAEATLQQYDAYAASDTTGLKQIIGILCRTYIAIARCKEIDVELFERASASFNSMPELAVYRLAAAVLPIGAISGDIDAVRRTCARIRAVGADVMAHVNGVPLGISAFYEWLMSDDVAFAQSLAALESGPGTTIALNRYLLESARGRYAQAEPDARPWVRVCGGLIAAALAGDGGGRARILRRCVADGRATNSPWWHGLALLAAAIGDAEQRITHLDEAACILAGTELTTMREAVAALRRGRPVAGFFASLAARLRQSPKGLTARAITISLARGSVSIDGKPAALGERRLELVLLLAAEGRPIHRSELLERLWPNSEPASAGNALRVLLSRVRKDVGPEAVGRIGDYYALDPSITTDLDRIETLLRTVREQRHLSDDVRSALHAELSALCVDGLMQTAWEWYGTAETRTSTLRCEAATVLYEEALQSLDYERAYGVARLLLDRDPCDELGCELAMRALIAAGDRAGARRELAMYGESLRSELGAAPAEYLYRLLERPPRPA